MICATDLLAVSLASLAPELAQLDAAAVTVTGIELDSRKVKKGDLFLACSGRLLDGRNFIGQAVAQGASAILAESENLSGDVYFESDVPVISVQGLSQRSSQIAGEFYGKPSTQIELFGVTGTNGKTTCSQIVAQLCRGIFGSCGVIGTLGNSLDGGVSEAHNTTPDGVTLQSLLAEWAELGVGHVAMEVSSHALDQGRVSGLNFDTAIFTNLTRDHLDYHGDMESYASAKSKLFNLPSLKRAVVNLDDIFGRDLIPRLPANLDTFTYSLKRPEADIFAEGVEFAANGIKARIRSPWGLFDIESPLLGSFNLSNVLACIGALGSVGASVEDIASNIVDLTPVTGRMELLPNTGEVQVVIDYAHTPDALKQALSALRFHSQNRLLCVFGCGGERDTGKRGDMGSVASKLADLVIVTSDNPRGENPDKIIEQIVKGCCVDVQVEANRASAIRLALDAALPGDTVLIAGKGHEQYQLVAGQRLPFSDIEHVEKNLGILSRENRL